MSRLKQRVALVTGGASGPGKAIAQRLVAEGATVIDIEVQREMGRTVADECGFVFLAQDVRDEKQSAHIVGEVERRCRRLANGGSIVNISSMADHVAQSAYTAHGASKVAVRHLTLSLAQYCAQEKLNVRCNSIRPNIVRTPLLNRAIAETAAKRGVPVDKVVSEPMAIIPLGDFTQAEDVAAAVAFLVSEDARSITGSALLVDGGLVHCTGSMIARKNVFRRRLRLANH